ncbi:MAG: DUF4405 domain-containing protein [Planctomycetota bacterium]|jgi:glucan phosphoethanolaminetransferase (alkaline phosphatase superfamily)
MKKAKLNLVIDVLLLLCTAAIVGIGLLMKYVLVPGFKRIEIYGRNVELYFLNLNRHEWGAIHLFIGYVFLFLLVLHIILHWSLIVSIYRKLIPNRPARWITAIIITVLTIALIVFSYFVEPEVQQGGARSSHQFTTSGLDTGLP